MKKTFITFIALSALVSFGMASSAHAFFVQVSASAAAIFGPVSVVYNTPRHGGFTMGNIQRIKINDQREVCAQGQDPKEDPANGLVNNFVILPLLVPGAGVPS